MRRVLPWMVLSILFALPCLKLNAQNDRFAYAITDLSKDGAGWNALRKLDLQTGTYSDILLNGLDQKRTIFDAVTHKQYLPKEDKQYGHMMDAPFSTGVAAAAYDRKNQRIYFTPMFIDQLRFIDLRTMKVYYVTDRSFTALGNMHNDEAKIVTRMVIAPDGNGYAITNDGYAFIRFSTGRKIKIEQLGSLVDDPVNNGISIHNRCSSFGGDVISDDKGNLYILSARNHVFKVNTKTKVATHLGMINGLPSTFTVNGAVVDGDGNLLVSSAVDATSYYVVNPKSRNASPYLAASGIFRSSDLANSNFLSSTCDIPTYTDNQLKKLIRPEDRFAGLIAVYPNPATVGQVNIQFNKVPAGNYMLELRDVLGRSIARQKISLSAESQTQTVQINESNAKGIYLIKLFDYNSKSVFTQKLLVQ